MLTRRRFVGYSALSSSMLAFPSLLRSGFGQTPSGSAPAAPGDSRQHLSPRFKYADPRGPLSGWLSVRGRLAHAECAGGLVYVDSRSQANAALEPAGDDGSQVPPAVPPSVAADWKHHEDSLRPEPRPTSDLSPARAKQFGFRLCSNIPEALALWRRPYRRRRRTDHRRAMRRFPYPSNDQGTNPAAALRFLSTVRAGLRRREARRSLLQPQATLLQL